MATRGKQMANNLIDMANGEKESSVLTPVLCPYRPSRSLPDPASLTLSPLGLRDTRTHKLPGRLLPGVGGPRNLEGGGSSLFPPPQSNPPPSTPQLAAEIRKTLFRPPSPPANSSSHFFISSSESLHLYSLALSSKSFLFPVTGRLSTCRTSCSGFVLSGGALQPCSDVISASLQR